MTMVSTSIAILICICTFHVVAKSNSNTILHHLVASKRDEADITDATDAQLVAMCEHAGCGYHTPPEIILSDYSDELPKILQYLKRHGLKVQRKHLRVMKHGALLERIIRIGDEDSMEYMLKFTRNKKVNFNADYRKYITGGIVHISMVLTSNVRQIDDGFFEKFFPNIEKLNLNDDDLYRRTTALPSLQIGFLPKLTYLNIETVLSGDLYGCTLPLGETSCFANNFRYMYLNIRNNERPSEIGLVNITLPENVRHIGITLGRVILKKTNITADKKFEKLMFDIETTKQIAGINFTNTEVQETLFIKGGKPEDSDNMIKDLDSMLHNPLIADKWTWRRRRASSIRIPVVFKSAAVEQPFEELDGEELGKITCKFASDVAKYTNDASKLILREDPENPQRTIKVLTVRGLYVDMTNLVDSSDASTFNEVEVTAFHVHISANRDVSYPLRVSYMKITSDDNAAIFNTVTSVNRNDIKSKGSTGTQLKLRNDVDAVFTQVIKICTAILIAQERNLGSIETSQNSVGNQMWSYPLPSILKGSDMQIVKAEQMIVRVGEFMEYLKETASEKAMKVPYLSLEYKQENMGILLNMAESIVEEKRHNEMMNKVEDVKEEILDNQDKATLLLLHTEYKRTVSLVLISTRRAHDSEKKLNASVELVKEVSAKFDTFKTEMEAANKTFQAGVRRAKAFAYAEVALAVTSSVISFFTGGFDPGKIARAAKKMKDLAFKIKKLMNLKKIFAKLASLIKTLRNIQELSRKASKSLGGRMGRLFEKLKNLRIKRKSYLEKLIKDSNSIPFKIPQLLKKKVENEKFIEKYTKIFEKVKTGRESVDYLNTAMQGIVEAEKAKVTLANAFTEGSVQDVHRNNPSPQPVTETVIDEALQNEFTIAGGDQQEQLEDLKKTLKEYELGESKNVIDEGEKLNAADVLEWDAANANVEGTMDASISMDIPETTSFKAALMKMNLAGKLKTQSMIDEAAIRVDLDRARFETTTYFKEGAEILKKIKKIQDDMKKRKSGEEDITSAGFKQSFQRKRREESLQVAWKEFNIKFQVLIASMSYCSAYYYYHLSLCPPEHSFDFETSLENMVHQQRELQRQSLLQLEDFYPPPQTMKERSIILTEVNDTCKCMIREQKSPDLARDPHAIYPKWISCAGNEISSRDVKNNETRRLLERLARGCENNKVEQMKDSHHVSVEIGIYSDFTAGHSRVRVDETQVILYGVKTNDGVVTMSIESSGVSQDVYKGEIFSFYGDKWRRDFSYYSPQSKVGSGVNRGDEQEIRILDAADVYRSFKGVYRTATLFTNWMIKIDPERNPGLDLRHLKKIEVKFSGSFVSAGDYKLPQRKLVEEEEDEEEKQRRKRKT